MQPFEKLDGIAVPLRRTDVDTDQIIPARFMKRLTKSGYEDGLFYEWRQQPDFVLNQDLYRNATILIAGQNFGTGSSREHAVWALRDFGFRAVFSSRFADIFRGNAGKQGLLAGEIEPAALDQIWDVLDRHPDTPVAVDLIDRQMTLGGVAYDFGIDEYTRTRLLEGLDEIDTTLKNVDEITRFESVRPSWLPRTLPIRDGGGTTPSQRRA
ncbi:3-isopropylmalate dehydratase small subunit [Pseudolysinimonas yzui]|uniref:3-isopropylmalate dehydratase small subunit n=1 Tax=Pseudolysinimonas yzui TaxID=2708254 RepID=A0A8J3GSJ8_9MICO|nr:3-isopropylmalate dehydratase small subunit [Pseudolysinimonas yzui]GHF22534.1 3-isopropylmalate dehydratase small subunit [Pseudolysinimonas yzui]